MIKKKLQNQKPWTSLTIIITIQSDDENNIFDVNLNDGYRSISWDPESFPTLDEIIEEFDY